MNEGIQGAIVGLMVAGAALYLLRKYLPRRRKAAPGSAGQAGSCGSCGGCKGGGCH
ncbi:MAG: hypothetical protein ACK4FZ_00580 [Vogesella sp.]|uniref:hypothetical protein n=1 Tax=Vogesella sp. TaxID=1904252 RepID=UPI00391BF115